jgi:peptidyl-prolyl cis-trans isomerase D
MLRGLHESSKGWLGRAVMAAVMGLLVISFAIWGIGDIFRGFGRQSFAKIGHTEIGIEQFRQLYRDRLALFGRQIGRTITLDQARQLGIDRQIIRAIISEFILDERVRDLKLGISDAEISRRIMSDPSFQTPNGQFDRQRFEFLLRQNGLTEARYVVERRRDMLRAQLAGTVIGPSLVTKPMIEAADRFQNEQRAIEYLLLDRGQAGEVPAPAPEVLAQFYEENKALFRAPEFRKVTYLALIPSEQARWMQISDEELKRAYEERKARYATPERRQVHQMVFPNAEEARAAAERIAKGESFEAIAKERGLSDQDIDLGLVTKAGMIDRAVADAAFALKEGEVSAPVTGRFGVVLVRVVKIEPEKVPTFEEIAQQLRTDLANDKAKEEMNDLYNKIEDERSIGKTLAEVADTVKLASRTIEIDRLGRDPQGNPVPNLPDAQRLIQSAFSTEPGVETDPLRVEGGYLWYEVTGITPSRERPLDEVKDQVETRWREQEIANRLKAKANEILDKAKGGAGFADAAAAAGLKVESKSEIKRGAAASPLSAQGVDAVFRVPKDGVGIGDGDKPGEQIVFRVTEVTLPTTDVNSEDSKKLKDQMSNAMSEDVYNEFIGQLESEIGVTINPAGLRQVVTGQNAPDDNN